MKRKKGLRSLIVLLAFLIFFFPAYSCFFTLAETNLAPADMSYESPDQDGLSMNAQSEFRGLAEIAPSISFFPVHNLFKWLYGSSNQTLSTGQRPFVLRC